MGQKVQGSSFSSTARDAPELAALQGLVATSSGVCCVATASSHAPELAALQQQASKLRSQQATQCKLRSLLRCKKATQCSGAWLPSLLRYKKATQAPEPGSRACCVAASKQARLLTFSCARGSRSNSSNSAPAPAAPAPQPQLQLPLHSRPRSLELWRWSEGGVEVVGGR